MNDITELEKSYIAGFFDGEGCISITKYTQKTGRNPSYALRTIVSQKHRNILDELRRITGIGQISKNGRGTYAWYMGPLESINLLRSILPYLQVKASEAKIAIEYYESIDHISHFGKDGIPESTLSNRDTYYTKLRVLKSRKRKGWAPYQRQAQL